ncbi:MAG TPA: prolyl oligopeptidase family serine peptidase [Candidatus Dormibacteraeota bacterium]|nr:prolyl oligopeptidase family serine peptidase [Candidatus Dormibacteraeota bacterium]
MSWLEQAIRRYEHRRWTTDDNRMVRPFEWGLEHIGGRADEPDLRAWLRRWSQQTLASSHEWFAADPATDYRLQDNVLTFSSAVISPWPVNNVVSARFYPAKKSGPAVLVLPNWNAKWHGQVELCRWLNKLGITALKMSMPYHDRRMVPGHERADQLVGSNIGLTLQANQQAVTDSRRCLMWLEQQGYTRLGILGTSIGSSVGYITMVHEPRVRAGAFLHVSTYFADVLSTGITTSHVWEAMRANVTPDELRQYWAPISPMPYVERGLGAGKRCLMISGRYDPTFVPALTKNMLDALHAHGGAPEFLWLPCGHYSLELPPFSYVAGLRLGTFLFQTLT